MSEPDKGHTADGDDSAPRSGRSMPFYPPPPGGQTGPPVAGPMPAPSPITGSAGRGGAGSAADPDRHAPRGGLAGSEDRDTDVTGGDPGPISGPIIGRGLASIPRHTGRSLGGALSPGPMTGGLFGAPTETSPAGSDSDDQPRVRPVSVVKPAQAEMPEPPVRIAVAAEGARAGAAAPEQAEAASGAAGGGAQDHAAATSRGVHADEGRAGAHREASGTGEQVEVAGRIRIEDEVIEKIAMLAALDVQGVAALSGGGHEGAVDSVHGPAVRRRRGARAIVQDQEVTLDLVLAVTYGSVVMDVARQVRSNVARVVGLMLDIRVAMVNVTIDDVRMPSLTEIDRTGGEVRTRGGVRTGD